MFFLKLIRLPNLLIIALTQCLLRYTVIKPLLEFSGKSSSVLWMEFLLIVLSTLLIAAGGYVINDIKDVRADFINKPNELIVGKQLSIPTAYKLYYTFTVTGVVTGFYLQFIKEVPYVGFILLVASGLLYFYSTTYKGIMLLGNVVVSLLTSLSLILILITEPLAIANQTILMISTGYFLFAFLMSLTREIIKDMEDMNGDSVAGYNTMPLIAGLNKTRYLVMLVIAFILSALIYIQVISAQWESLIPFLYVLLFIEIPLFLLFIFMLKANDENDFSKASMLTKGIMITGLLSMLIFYLSFN